MAVDTGAGARAAVKRKGTPLKAQILAACAKEDLTCYDLEDKLNRTHQSVSGSIRYLVLDGQLEILPFTRANKFGNQVRVYRTVVKP